MGSMTTKEVLGLLKISRSTLDNWTKPGASCMLGEVIGPLGTNVGSSLSPNQDVSTVGLSAQPKDSGLGAVAPAAVVRPPASAESGSTVTNSRPAEKLNTSSRDQDQLVSTDRLPASFGLEPLDFVKRDTSRSLDKSRMLSSKAKELFSRLCLTARMGARVDKSGLFSHTEIAQMAKPDHDLCVVLDAVDAECHAQTGLFLTAVLYRHPSEATRLFSNAKSLGRELSASYTTVYELRERLFEWLNPELVSQKERRVWDGPSEDRRLVG